MTREDLAKAVSLADEILQRATPRTKLHRVATQLRQFLEPPLPMPEILAKVPGDSIAAKCRTLEISRQAFYDLQKEETRPNNVTTARLMELTGLADRQIRI